MRLLRVRVPGFKVLKNIDITFEKDFVPSIFPIGSQNGGGKSTLLQLIFVLLYCSSDPERLPVLESSLHDFKVAENQERRTLAVFDILVDNSVVEIEFLVRKDSSIDLKIKKNYGDRIDIGLLLKSISDKIFLAIPYSRSHLTDLNSPNLFVYDSPFIDSLINLFKEARNKDFGELVKTGEYGGNYKKLLSELNSLLLNKTINIAPDLSEVTFVKVEFDQMIELSIEDLSHGELKRLGIFVWLRCNKIENGVVLMDEIEASLHPDLQHGITLDLERWASSNQYILATHSYDVCQVLTPAHVKNLDLT